MSDKPVKLTPRPEGYAGWLADVKGFSRTNLMYMRAFAAAWPDEQIVQQAVGQLPWGHNLVLLTQLKDPAQRLQVQPIRMMSHDR